jgi:hypothetical protein
MGTTDETSRLGKKHDLAKQQIKFGPMLREIQW